jgi:Protein of unknown function (DUF3467)
MAQNQVGESSREPKEGRYANHFHVGHNAFEVILDFGQFYEGNDQPWMHTRIVTSPAYALSFWQLMGCALQQYESSFGAISPDFSVSPGSSGRPHE